MQELKTIAWIPSSSLYLKNKIFDEKGSRDLVYQPFSELKKSLNTKGINVQTYDLISDDTVIDIIVITRIDYNFKNLIGLLRKNPKAKVIYIVTEENTVCPIHNKKLLKSAAFDKVLTWIPDWVDGDYFDHYFYPNPFRTFDNKVKFNQKKHLVMINSYHKVTFNKVGELYSLRADIARFFLDHGLELYGSGWDRNRDISRHKNYKGQVESKIETMQNYKFAIAIENTGNECGAVTEKIFDAMTSGCIPIYFGAPDIEEYIPKTCFINLADFKNLESLKYFLESITENEYNAYISEIKTFLNGPKYKKFTSHGFINSINKAISDIESNAPSAKYTYSIRYEWAIKLIFNPKLFLRRPRMIFEILVGL